jgi:hypothetical protein
LLFDGGVRHLNGDADVGFGGDIGGGDGESASRGDPTEENDNSATVKGVPVSSCSIITSRGAVRDGEGVWGYSFADMELSSSEVTDGVVAMRVP